MLSNLIYFPFLAFEIVCSVEFFFFSLRVVLSHPRHAKTGNVFHCITEQGMTSVASPKTPSTFMTFQVHTLAEVPCRSRNAPATSRETSIQAGNFALLPPKNIFAQIDQRQITSPVFIGHPILYLQPCDSGKRRCPT